ncbi:MAG: hypothetical protein ACLQAT_22475 [Candidatus Binataceae bacterium]
MVRRQRAQAVALDLQRTVEARAEILQRDRRRQLDDLLRAEQRAYLFEDLVGDIRRRARNPSA